MSLDPVVDLIHTPLSDSWKPSNERALEALFGTRYAKRAEKLVTLRAPWSQVPFAAYIHPASTDSGAYGGMSFVMFPGEEKMPCLIGMVIGIAGLEPDHAILGRPGHGRRMQAICDWLNKEFGKGDLVAWAKHDPTRTDLSVPDSIQRRWGSYQAAFQKYGHVMYAMFRPTENREATLAAVKAMLDVMFEERGCETLTAHRSDSEAIRSKWFSCLMPQTSADQVVRVLGDRRYVILQGPPGTGKTEMARGILLENYQGRGRSIQFHPTTSYENFIGGLAPVQGNGSDALGFRFAPQRGFLMEAAAEAVADSQARPYLLHVDEINRADLGKVLGEAIYLLEPRAIKQREIRLPYDFGDPYVQRFHLPNNLHILGTMNSSDRSIAIVDVAVRRRFAFLSLWPSLDVVKDKGCDLGIKAFEELMSIFVEHAPEESLALAPGHSYFLGNESEVRTSFKTAVEPLLQEYLEQGYVTGFAESIRGYLQWLRGQ